MRPTLSLASVVVASPDQISATLADEVVILGLRDGVYYGLDPVGRRIWELLMEERTVTDICGRIIERYDVERDQCERDVLNLLEELNERHLIEVRRR